jgi:hypothetical protein
LGPNGEQIRRIEDSKNRFVVGPDEMTIAVRLLRDVKRDTGKDL